MEQQIKVSGFLNFQSVSYMEIELCANKHGYVKVGGILTEASYARYKNNLCILKMLQISLNDDTMLFHGVITHVNIQEDVKLRYVELEGATESILMDLTFHKRSFSNVQMNYKDVLNFLKLPQISIRAGNYSSEIIRTPLIQYDRTNWEFIKYRASRLQTVVLAGYTNYHSTIFIGNPKNSTEQKPYRLNDSLDFKRKQIHFIQTTLKAYCRWNRSPIEQWQFSYEENLDLGDWVSWKGMNLQIFEKKCIYKNGILEMEYRASPERFYRLTDSENISIGGLTLEGTALATDRERIKVRLDIEATKNLELNNAYSYPYMPESGNVFYTMPEPGMKICLYFPDGYEEHGYIIHGKRIKLKSFPDKSIKEFHSFNEKILRLTQGTLQLLLQRNNDPGYICLDSSKGVGIQTCNHIRLIAKGDIQISSERMCMAEAGAQILLKQIGTDNYIDINGDDTVYRAEKYVAASGLRDRKVPSKNRETQKVKVSCGIMLDYAAGGIPLGLGNELQLAVLGGTPSAMGFAKDRNIHSALGKSIKR